MEEKLEEVGEPIRFTDGPDEDTTTTTTTTTKNNILTIQESLKELGFNLDKYDYPNKDKLLRNCVPPKIGLAILESALNIYEQNNLLQTGLFGDCP